MMDPDFAFTRNAAATANELGHPNRIPSRPLDYVGRAKVVPLPNVETGEPHDTIRDEWDGSRIYVVIRNIADSHSGVVIQSALVAVPSTGEGGAGRPACVVVADEGGVTRASFTEEMVVLKRIPLRRTNMLGPDNPEAEIAALQSLRLAGKHPNVIQLLDVLQNNECKYIVFPYYPRRSLLDVYQTYDLRRLGLEEPLARNIFRQIMNGVEHLHRNGISHCDLKMSNILISDDNGGTCVVADLGMCLRIPYDHPGLDDPHAMGTVHAGTLRRLIRYMGVGGTQHYYAPELYSQRPAFDAFAIDLWAIGVMLFAMLTGGLPWHVPDPDNDRLYRRIAVEHDLAGELTQRKRDGISEDAQLLLQTMLFDEPAMRLHHAEIRQHPWLANEHEAPISTMWQHLVVHHPFDPTLPSRQMHGHPH